MRQRLNSQPNVIVVWRDALIGRENCGRSFSTSLRRSIYSGFISLRKQPIDVPPNDLIT
jgi:hypothetical protein